MKSLPPDEAMIHALAEAAAVSSKASFSSARERDVMRQKCSVMNDVALCGRHSLEESGDPYENRTRVASVKGMCPNR